MSSLDQLAELVGWRGTGVRGIPWRDLEHTLGIPLPGSFKQYVERFPSGGYQTYLNVIQPLSSADGELYLKDLKSCLQTLRVVKRYADDFQLGIYPQVPGLLPWGAIESDAYLCWHISHDQEGEPEIVMIDSDDGSHTVLYGTMVDAILEVIQGRVAPFEFLAEEYAPPRFDVHDPSVLKARGPRPPRDHYRVDSPKPRNVPMSFSAVKDISKFLTAARRPMRVPWRTVEKGIRHRLPWDFKRLIETIGPGRYGDIVVVSPQPADDLPDLVSLTAAAAVEADEDLEGESPIGPVVWGKAPHGWYCGWVPGNFRVHGRPVLLFHPRVGSKPRDCSMASYLSEYLRNPKDWDLAPWLIGEPE